MFFVEFLINLICTVTFDFCIYGESGKNDAVNQVNRVLINQSI